MALFDGISLGQVTECYVVPKPKRRQLDSFAGVNGYLSQDMGTAGGTAIVIATFYAPNLFLLNQIELGWYGYQSGGEARTFVDNLGNSINNCILDLYEPLARIKVAADGGAIREARFTFLFLT